MSFVASVQELQLPSEVDTIAVLDMPGHQLAALQQAYASPPRAYHHFGHVREVLAHYRDVADGPGWQQPLEVLYAVLYHDAVYVPGRSDNEAESARLAVDHLTRWQSDGCVDPARVSELILLTARHGSLGADDFGQTGVAEDTRRFLDCDMAILGATSEAFAEYDRAIAEEYAAVPRWLYGLKRRQFFRKLLRSERIFLSDFFRDRFELQARRNIQAML
jgi:predicted metal-dependent HD superfamily phosphohydrolase